MRLFRRRWWISKILGKQASVSRPLCGTRIKTNVNHLRNRLLRLVELGKLPPNVSLPVIVGHIFF
jgi:hypothetical protein